MTPDAPPPPPSAPLPAPTAADWGKTPAPYDGISIGALICSLLCCAAPAGVVLGVIGVLRTREGRRRGRWMAVTGLVLGGLISLAMSIAAVVGIVLTVQSAGDDLDLAAAQPGMCIDFDWLDTPNTASCTGEHEGEIVWSGRMNADLIADWNRAEYIDDFCYAQTLPEIYADTATDSYYEMGYDTDTFSGEPKTGSPMICYLRASAGKLTGPVDDQTTASGSNF